MEAPSPQTETLDPGAVSAGIVFHDTLNPKLFDEQDEMRLDVRVHLLKTAIAFYEFLALPDLQIIDVVFTGSNASYNYTPYSDCDVHIVVEYARTAEQSLADNLFSTKKALWGATRAITVKGYPVELYVEDVDNPVNALGVFSLLTGTWEKHPRPEKPQWDDGAVYAKADHIADQIEALVTGGGNPQAMAAMMAKIRRMRQAGLAKGGEFSTENLAFKALRNVGLLDDLRAAMVAAEDRSLSV